MNIKNIKFDEKGLVPVVVQDYENGQVLMVAHANREAIEKTLETKRAHFWSRSRNKLWQKGEESGNFQEVKEVFLDCDGDTVLIVVDQKGVACHTGERTCFFTSVRGDEQSAPSFNNGKTGKVLYDVYRVIEERKQNPREGSYVSGLFKKGLDDILKKIGEEAGETIIAAKNGSRDEIIYEITDLWFHSLVTLSYFGISDRGIYNEFERRFGKSKESYRQNK